MEEKINALPNIFYDLIVFSVSTVIFTLGLFIGLGLYNTDIFKGMQTMNYILIILGIITVGYEYGRIAEAWSAILVQTPLKFLKQKKIIFKNPNFLHEISGVEEYFSTTKHQSSTEGGKWFIYFYSSLVNSRIGLDLMKRYAWEKLSRNSAFTFCILFITSLIILIVNLIKSPHALPIEWEFGSINYSVGSLIMVIFTYYEYYKRNCWNTDLLIKSMPVLKVAKELLKLEKKIEIVINGEKQLDLQLSKKDDTLKIRAKIQELPH